MTFSPLKSARWLLDHLNDPLVRVLDCRAVLTSRGQGAQAYREGHIPGAVHAELDEQLSAPARHDRVGGRHPLPDPYDLARWLGEQGIGDDHTVICYDDPGQGQGFYATRAWWLLRWLGHRETYVLDGGWTAWTGVGGAVEQDVRAPEPVTFTPRVRPELVADADEVAARPADVLLIDARAPERYRGESEPLDWKAGHIPGAVNREWKEVLRPDGTFRAPQELTAMLDTGGQLTITYCGSGVSATPNLLALELAGIPLGEHNRLYVGSWSDWISDDAREVALGHEP